MLMHVACTLVVKMHLHLSSALGYTFLSCNIEKLNFFKILSYASDFLALMLWLCQPTVMSALYVIDTSVEKFISGLKFSSIQTARLSKLTGRHLQSGYLCQKIALVRQCLIYKLLKSMFSLFCACLFSYQEERQTDSPPVPALRNEVLIFSLYIFQRWIFY